MQMRNVYCATREGPKMLRILKNDQCANEKKIKGMQMCSVRPCQAGWYIYPWEPVRVLHNYSYIRDILANNVHTLCPDTVSTSRWALMWTLFLDSTPEFQHGAIARVWALKWAPVPDCKCFLLVPTLWDIELRTTNYGKYSVGFKGAIIWNSLPLNIRNISSYNMFKNKVKEYVIKKEL